MPSTSSQARSSASITAGESELAGGLSSHSDGDVVAAAVELDGRGLVARLGLRVRVEALAALGAQAALRDEPAQHERRREVLAPLLLGPLERGEHVVEAAEVGAGERPGDHAGAHHQAEVDLAHPGDALLEHEAGLDDRLEREALGDPLVELRLRQRCS